MIIVQLCDQVPGIASIPISIEMICDCDCEKDDSKVVNSEVCQAAGDLVCGSCQCHTGSYGEKCEVILLSLLVAFFIYQQNIFPLYTLACN